MQLPALEAVATGSSVQLNFDVSEVLEYRVRKRGDGGWFSWSEWAPLPADHVITGLEPGIYQFMVRGMRTAIAEVTVHEGSPHGAHAHWRVLVFEREGSNAYTMAELEFRATPGGADQAVDGTALASEAFWGAADSAFDNNPGTFWGAGDWAPTPLWLAYQFLAPVSVAEVAIQARAGIPSQSPKNFAVEYSDDGANWTAAWSVQDQVGWVDNETRVFTDPAYP